VSSAWGISNMGHVVGQEMKASFNHRAFIWSNGRMQDLGHLPGLPESYAYGVNDSGHVVGSSGTIFLEERAFLRTTGAMKDLGTLGGSNSRATAINNLGHVVGFSETKMPFHNRAFLYTNGTMKDLGVIGAHPQGVSKALDINDKEQIVGYSTVRDDLLTHHATLWQNGTVKDLGTLIGFLFSYATSINNSGHVVGFVTHWEDLPGTYSDLARRAFLYRDGRLLDLNHAIPVNSPWILMHANAISDSGVIVGYGRLNNEFRAFMLTPLR
jgi:probable HAF family extracellular repeat protein